MSTLTRFGLFEADLSSGELRKQGRVIRLQHQPFELLKVLLARPGEIVSRDDLRRHLWPADVSVDFDQSLNKSVTKLRDALGDSAVSPRFIETVPKRGYRFIASVTVAQAETAALALPTEARHAAQSAADLTPALPTRSRALVARAVVALSCVLVLVALLNFSDGRPDRHASSPAPTESVAPARLNHEGANEAYNRGRLALSRRTEEGLRSGISLFERSLAMDPGFASAHVGLSDAWSLLASHGMEEPGPALQRAREFAARALTLNPDDADAHASMGRLTMIGEWDWKKAEQHFLRAIALREASATSHRWYAYLLSATGRHAEAEHEARRAVELEPASLNAATGVGYVLYSARRFDAAAAELERVLEVDPDFIQARRNLGRVLAMQGRNREASAQFERVVRLSGESAIAQADLVWIRGRSGELAEARRLLARLQANADKHYLPPDALALALSGTGQIEAALRALQQAYRERGATMAHFAIDPLWDTMRELPSVRVIADAVKAGRSD